MFIQIHTLTPFPAVLLNRDMVGHGKCLPFGGVRRTRVSSQCLKRHWRTCDGANALTGINDQVELSVRSRVSFQRYVLEPLIQDGIDPAVAAPLTTALVAFALALREPKEPKDSGATATAKGSKKVSKKAKAQETQEPDDESEESDTPPEEPQAPTRAGETSQVTVLGKPELEFLLNEARTIAQNLKGTAVTPKIAADAVKAHFDPERKKNLKGLVLGAGIDAAMFGRMVTSDVFARTDAAIYVAHAFTVSGEAVEDDFFVAVDDLTTAEKGGSGHLSSTQLTSGLFYSYVVIDLGQLQSNMTGMPTEVISEVVRRFIHLIATVSPGAKLGSTAPFSCAQFMMIEVSTEQPRTLASAFEVPVSPRDGLLKNSIKALGDHLSALDKMYSNGTSYERRLSTIQDNELQIPSLSIPDLATWAATRAQGG